MGMQAFFYGSLIDRELLALVIGRATDGLRMEAATLHDFVRRRALNESFPILVTQVGGQVEGVLVTDLTIADIDRLKFYEGSDYEGAEYMLTALPVECRGERLVAQVFLPTAHILAEETAWDFDSWAATERTLFMAMVEARMSGYGSVTTAENHAMWPQMKAEVERRFRRRGDHD